MKAHTASLINAILLIALGLWGYLSSDTPSNTALIPVAFGAILLLLNPGVKKENKVIAHVAVLLTLVCLLGLAMPLRGTFGRGDTLGSARVIVMMLSSVFAMFAFIQSFRAARRARG